MARVAAVDCGTNSLRLLVADVDEAGRVHDVVRTMDVVRLGEGVDRTGTIGAEAMARAFAVCDRHAATCADLGVEAVRFVATSASRDARNRDEFVAGVRARLGVDPEVVSGTEEASLSFVGATAALGGDLPGPYLVVDLGGGSTEFVLGGPGQGPTAARSVDVGCVRLHERHAFGDPPTAGQLAAARADVAVALDLAAQQVPLARARTLVGVAGTVTTVTAHALGLDAYDPARIDGTVLPVARTVQAAAELTAMTVAARERLGFMHPGRSDVIGAGALVWRCVVERVALESGITEVVTSEHDILDGIAVGLDRGVRAACGTDLTGR